MKDSINNRKKKLLALCLSVMTFSSAMAMFSCSDKSSTDSSSSSSSSSSTSEVKDEGLIKNAGFETYDDENLLNTTVTGWSRSVNSVTSGSALSSKAASGIIDLSEDAWHNLTGSNKDVSSFTEAQAEAEWDNLTVKDKLTYYEKWEEANEDKKIAEKLDFYESLNIDLGDIPTIDRFATHHKEGDDGYGEDYKVLMIHNEYPESDSTATYKALGTAQKFTSSSTVTVKAGTAAQFSVWVKTQDLKSSATDGSVQDAVGKGAYISVTHSVGGTKLDEYKVENINTEAMGVTDNNGWKQYTFYFRGSSYTDSTFSVVLGLGQGGGTYRAEYVNGYAFFDDIQCKIIDDGAFNDTINDYSLTPATFTTEKEAKIVDASETPDAAHFAMDFYAPDEDINNTLPASGAPTTSKVNGVNVSSSKEHTPASWLKGGLDSTKDVAKVFDNVAAIAADTNATAMHDKYLKDDTTASKVLLLLSDKGVAYEATSSAISFPVIPATSEVSKYMAVSFMVKTSDMHGYTGAGVTLKDGNNETAFASIDTSDMEGTDVGDKKDVYQGWQQYFFFVENDSDDDTTTFELVFNYGPTEISTDTKLDGFHAGFAAFTNLKTYTLSKAEFESAQEGTFAKIVTVKGDKEDEPAEGSSFDTPAGTPSKAIEIGLANAQNYKGYYSDDAKVVGGSASSTPNAYKNAGLISKKYFTDATEGYFGTAVGTEGYAWLDGLKGLYSGTAEEVWKQAFDANSAQPLFIWEDGVKSTPYGFIGKSTEIAANSYVAVSVRVKGNGGKAYIRLVDTNSANYGDVPKAYDQVLSIGRNLTYWYDDNGNICTGDPSEKATQIAFKLQTNGLYKANKSWDGYNDLTDAQKNGYFANLEAYATDPVTNDKLVAKSGASHNYSDKWNNEGMDGIAFYYKDGAYYADRAKTISVINLKDIAGLNPRHTAIGSNQKLEAEITTVANTWQTVTFYIHTGDLAKSYRLELWNSDKSFTSNGAGKYVVFDYNNPGAAQDNFTNLLTEYDEMSEGKTEDGITEITYKNGDNDVVVGQKYDGVFSYFDTANYLRYNASLDENKIGNLYEEGYVPSANVDGIAYLLYNKDNEYTVFADYSYSEKAVTAAEVEDDSKEEEDSSSDDETETNVWLLISSLAVAGVLILAVASIVIRKLVVKARKKRASQGIVKKTKKNKKSN